MGLESVNYLFKCDKIKSKEMVIEFLKRKFPSLKEKEGFLIYFDQDFWIDLKLSEQSITVMSIRIALCNPLEGVERGFKDLLDSLFSFCEKSVLLDLKSNETIQQLE